LTLAALLNDAGLEALPASARDLAGIVGLPAAIGLLERFGGMTALYVPKDVSPGHDLARIMGEAAARKLSSVYGGDYLRNIPRCAGAMRAVRDRAVVRRKSEGAAPRDIAQEFGLTERWVWEILARSRQAEPQQYRLPGM
jgi:hypothetical protein